MTQLLKVKIAPQTAGGEPSEATINVLHVVLIEPDPDDPALTLVTLAPARVVRVMEPYEGISGVIERRTTNR